MENFKYKFGNKEITIDSNFSIITGKFQKSSLKGDNINNFKQIAEIIDQFPVELLINIFMADSIKYTDLQKSKKFLETLHNFKEKNQALLRLINDFMTLADKSLQILRYIYLNNKKSELEEEIEISRLYHQSSELSAIKDLISKLNDSILKNKQTISYLQRDFQQVKNQRDKIQLNIDKLSSKIDKTIQYKKECFNEVNKITRNMEKDLGIDNSDLIKNLGIDLNLSASEKIRLLQKKAQEAQYEINQFKKELENEQKKSEMIKPEYDSYLHDYNKFLQEIENDEKKLVELNKEIEMNLEDQICENDHLIIQFKEKAIRPVEIIESEYKTVLNNIEEIRINRELYDPDLPMNVGNIKMELEEISKRIKIEEEKYLIQRKNNDFHRTLNSLRALESLLFDLETLLNKFLSEISLRCYFHLEISEKKDLFLLNTYFLRKSNEGIAWEALTTPEKVFFVMTFFIAIKVLLKYNPLVFSNTFLPQILNKRGSILRTISKVIPLFELEEELKEFKLIFILSSLEIKKEIEKVKLIKIN